MSNIISQLYKGELDPESLLGNSNVELRKTEVLIEKNFNKIKENLDEDTVEILNKYRDCINEYIVLSNEQAFCDGFCLGTRMVSEAVGGAERIL